METNLLKIVQTLVKIVQQRGALALLLQKIEVTQRQNSKFTLKTFGEVGRAGEAGLKSDL